MTGSFTISGPIMEDQVCIQSTESANCVIMKFLMIESTTTPNDWLDGALALGPYGEP